MRRPLPGATLEDFAGDRFCDAWQHSATRISMHLQGPSGSIVQRFQLQLKQNERFIDDAQARTRRRMHLACILSCTYICMYIYTYMYICVFMVLFIYVYMILVYVYVNTCIYMYICYPPPPQLFTVVPLTVAAVQSQSPLPTIKSFRSIKSRAGPNCKYQFKRNQH